MTKFSRNDAVEKRKGGVRSCDAPVAEGAGDASSPGLPREPNGVPVFSRDEGVARTFCDGASQLRVTAAASFRFRITGNFINFMLAGLVILAGAGCEQQPTGSAASPEPAVTFKPQEMADALHAVIAADQKTFVLQSGDENLMALHAQRLRQASESVQQEGAEFHYVLRSLWPINPKNAPETDTEKAGLQYVFDHPGTNYYGGESLGGRRYFTAIYAEVATVNACADCHNRNPDSPKKDFKTGDAMGGLVVRVPLEF
jgi:hypothetical protein